MVSYILASQTYSRRHMSQHNTLFDNFTIDLSTGEINTIDLHGEKLDINFQEIDTEVYAMLFRWIDMQRRRDGKEEEGRMEED